MITPHSKGNDTDARIAEILEAILSDHTNDRSATTESYLAAHPEIAEELRSCLRALEYLQVAGDSPATLNRDTESREACTLGDYCIVREIGRGGMGIVFEAIERSLNRRVALKVLPWATLLGARQRQRFRNEAHISAQLHHTNIVPVFAVGSDRGIDFYAMQFIEGETLSVWGTRRRSDPSSRTAGLIQSVAMLGAQAAEALAYAHGMGIIHRDIKPTNLLIDERHNLWVSDFGVARSLDLTGDSATGDRIGTLRYMSPEQRSGTAVDRRTDIYSLGVTLCELLDFDARAQQSLPSGPGLTDIDRCSAVARTEGSLPRDLRLILRKACAAARENRYGDAQEFADDLHRFLRGEPIAINPLSAVTKVANWGTRHRRSVAVVLLALICSLAALAVTTALVSHQRSEAERQRDRAESESRRVEQLLARSQSSAAVERLKGGDSRGLLELVAARRTAGRHPALARDLESLWSRWRALFEGRLLQVLGHRDPITQVALSPNSGILVTVSNDHTVALWNVQTGAQLDPTLHHDNKVTTVQIDADGRTFATGDAFGEIRLFSVSTGAQVGSIRRHLDGPLRRITFAPNGSTLASYAEGSKTVCLWRLDSDDLSVQLEHPIPIVDMTFVGDRNLLATAAGNALRLWDTETNALRLGPIRHEHSIELISANADGAFIATACLGGSIRVLNSETGRDAGPSLHQPKLPLHMRFSPHGQWLAASSSDQSVRFWNTSSWQETRLKHPKRISYIAFSPDDQDIVTGTVDGGIRVWNTATGELKGAPVWHQGSVRLLGFDPSGSRLVSSSSDHTARIWNVEPKRRGELLQDTSAVRALAVSPDSRSVVCGVATGSLTCWNLSKHEMRWKVDAHRERVTSVAYSPDGSIVASASEDCCVRLWNAVDGSPRAAPLRFSEGVKGIAFCLGGKALVIGCNDKTMTTWDMVSYERRQLVRDREAIKAVAVDSTGSVLSYGTNGWLTHILRLGGSHNSQMASLRHDERVRSLCFSPTFDGILAVGGEDGVVRLWNTSDCSSRGTPLEQGGEVVSICIDAKGSFMAVAPLNCGAVRLWDLRTNLGCDGVPLARSGSAQSVGFVPDGTLLVSGWDDGACWLWPVPKMPRSLSAMEEATAVTLGARLDKNHGTVPICGEEWRQLLESSDSAN